MTPMSFREENIEFDISKHPNLIVNIRTRARNGIWEQQIKFRKSENGEYQYETSVIPFYDQSNPLVSKKYEDSGMPQGSIANIDSLKFKRE